MNTAIHLKTFSEEEIILSEEETRVILRFFFPKTSERLDDAVVTNDMKGFAQGLLVEAIDATYAMGYVEILVNAIYAAIFPPATAMPAVKIIKDFSRKAASHWFKNAIAADRVNVKIYEMIRVEISESFDVIMGMHLDGVAVNKPYTAFINYADVVSPRHQWVWS